MSIQPIVRGGGWVGVGWWMEAAPDMAERVAGRECCRVGVWFSVSSLSLSLSLFHRTSHIFFIISSPRFFAVLHAATWGHISLRRGLRKKSIILYSLLQYGHALCSVRTLRRPGGVCGGRKKEVSPFLSERWINKSLPPLLVVRVLKAWEIGFLTMFSDSVGRIAGLPTSHENWWKVPFCFEALQLWESTKNYFQSLKKYCKLSFTPISLRLQPTWLKT